LSYQPGLLLSSYYGFHFIWPGNIGTAECIYRWGARAWEISSAVDAKIEWVAVGLSLLRCSCPLDRSILERLSTNPQNERREAGTYRGRLQHQKPCLAECPYVASVATPQNRIFRYSPHHKFQT
jgi:hypothetical protein